MVVRLKFFILDNGLVDRRAHNFHLVAVIAGALRRRDIQYSVFVSRRASAEILDAVGAIPLFRHYLYESIGLPKLRQIPAVLSHLLRGLPGPLPRDSRKTEAITARRLNRSFGHDLSRLPGEVWNPHNVVLIPGICQNQILGLVRYLSALPLSQRPKVICQLMFAPEWTPWGAVSVYGDSYYRQAFEIARPLIGHSLFFTTETAGLSAEYGDRYQVTPAVVGVPLSVDIAHFGRASDSGYVTFGYLGYSKTSRGFHLLPEAIANLDVRGRPARFLVQVQHSGWEPIIAQTVEKLRSLNSVHLVEGVLDRNAYYDLLRQSDAVLLPYDATHYGERGSGVTVEAVSSGRPIVTMEGTWPGNLVNEGQAEGELFAEFTSAALAQAIERLLQRIAPAAARAAEIAPEFARRFSGDRYIDTVLGLAGHAISPR